MTARNMILTGVAILVFAACILWAVTVISILTPPPRPSESITHNKNRFYATCFESGMKQQECDKLWRAVQDMQ